MSINVDKLNNGIVNGQVSTETTETTETTSTTTTTASQTPVPVGQNSTSEAPAVTVSDAVKEAQKFETETTQKIIFSLISTAVVIAPLLIGWGR